MCLLGLSSFRSAVLESSCCQESRGLEWILLSIPAPEDGCVPLAGDSFQLTDPEGSSALPHQPLRAAAAR